ncbi:MAG: DUF6746 family protein [Alphaproteobacteria bacterium]
MNKFLTVLTISVLSAGVSSYSMAKTVVDTKAMSQEARDAHYKASIATSDQAFKALEEKVSEISEILKNEGELEFLELESIHEISYTLEAAVDRLRDEKAADIAKLDILDEAVQAIHFASEKQKEAQTREWFAKLKPAAGDIKKGTEISDAEPVKKEFYEITIKDHKFSPIETVVPAGQKIKLRVSNQDATPEEFESHDMNREKIISGNKTATIFVGPLKPGKYHYFGEFNMDTANGYIIAK